ncbi:MAG: hydantoinase/oxoprolinase N-terminal domain-containing protein, partial [Paracoccaceae bacterium]
MAILLGIDTGGTYTDAVLIDDQIPAPGIVAKAKALTTRHDLSIGIGGAVDGVLALAQNPDGIGLVSVSTTLATNALVEGQGGR